MTPVSRRSFVQAGSVAVSTLATGAFPRLTPLQPDPALKPDPPSKPKDHPPATPPVSQTAAAQEGTPRVPEKPPEKLRVALVGLGKLMVGEILPALALAREIEISALVTGDPAKGRAVADHLELPRERVFGYADIPKFDADPTIDAVYIATPNAIHERDTVAALRAGKHVLCEKPMAATLEQADNMLAAARDADRKLMIAYRVHHEPINLKIRQMLREQLYGKPRFVAFDACLDVGGKPQPRLSRKLAGGGSLFDIGIYALNTTCWLLGETPVEVSAMQINDPSDTRFDEVEGSIAFQLRFPSGCVATCTSSYGTARVNRYRIICEKGWMGMDPATHYRGLKGEHADDSSISVLTKPEPVNQFAAEFDHFARCLRTGQPVDSPGEEGRRDLALMLRIYQAAAEGRTLRL